MVPFSIFNDSVVLLRSKSDADRLFSCRHFLTVLLMIK